MNIDEITLVENIQVLSDWIHTYHDSINISDNECSMILGYMEGSNYGLGFNENTLYRIDFDYGINTINIEEYSIEDAIYDISEWNKSLIEDAPSTLRFADPQFDCQKYCNNLNLDEQSIKHLEEKLYISSANNVDTELMNHTSELINDVNKNLNFSCEPTLEM